jgi:hypothetical protein
MGTPWRVLQIEPRKRKEVLRELAVAYLTGKTTTIGNPPSKITFLPIVTRSEYLTMDTRFLHTQKEVRPSDVLALYNT